MAGFDQKFNFPSGVQLPFILRKKLEAERAQASQEGTSTTAEGSATATAASQKEGSGIALTKGRRNRVFTSEELENKIWKSSVALVEIQKQIHRGEEAYYEETFGHGSLFKGWEGFLDAKDVGATSNSKPPRDTRWFSGSSSISRTARPPPIHTQWSASTQRPGQLSNKTPTSAPVSAVSQAASTTIESRTTPVVAPAPVVKTPTATTSETKSATPVPAAASTTNPEAPPKQPTTAEDIDPKQPEGDQTVEKAADSFRIPKKKKKTDPAVPAAPATAKIVQSNPPSKQTENNQSTPSEQTSETVKGSGEAPSSKKSKAGRKRKGFD